MADIKIHTEHTSAKTVLFEAVQAEKNRIGYACSESDKAGAAASACLW
ncbi:MAG: hypothetical protein U9P36_06550 [Thermodesulfobacteriota bacterium]|nr:hypothetical protein [Thermodesulfobacteriota bacterium]